MTRASIYWQFGQSAPVQRTLGSCGFLHGPFGNQHLTHGDTWVRSVTLKFLHRNQLISLFWWHFYPAGWFYLHYNTRGLWEVACFCACSKKDPVFINTESLNSAEVNKHNWSSQYPGKMTRKKAYSLLSASPLKLSGTKNVDLSQPCIHNNLQIWLTTTEPY